MQVAINEAYKAGLIGKNACGNALILMSYMHCGAVLTYVVKKQYLHLAYQNSCSSTLTASSYL